MSWFAWWHRWRARVAEEKEEERLLNKQGFVCYCDCGRTLNEQKCVALGDDTYVYTCECGERTRFLFGPPVPIMIPLDEEVLPLEPTQVSRVVSPEPERS